MKLAYSTGNPIIDEVSEMNITGNIIPATWYHTMCGENGKPKLLAINLLSDILYWYRPKEIRDEETGNLLGFQKRFKADLLQRSYRQIENQFGVSQKQARNALDYHCDIGVVRKHLRNEKTKEGMPIHNNMYLELVPDKLRELTYPRLCSDDVPFREPPSALEGRRVVPKKTEGGAPKGTTSTENTTKITTRDNNNPIYGEDSQMEDFYIYEHIVKDQIEYECLIQDNNGIDQDANVCREQWTAENNFHEEMETVVERMEENLAERFIRLQDALIEQMTKQLSEYAPSTVSDEERGLVDPYKDETEQVPDIVMSDAMMSMALTE